ncbi:hypothetical protein AALB16_10940 [Lachnospiraceae bacterium 62-35]
MEPELGLENEDISKNVSADSKMRMSAGAFFCLQKYPFLRSRKLSSGMPSELAAFIHGGVLTLRMKAYRLWMT